MSHPVFNVELPQDVYEHVVRAARGTRQPVEKALVNIVKGATPSLDKVPVEYRPELEALEDLSDKQLWALSASRLDRAKVRRLQRLLDKNERGEMTPRDQHALEELRGEADRLMLRRSYAILLLKYRGHPIAGLQGLP